MIPYGKQDISEDDIQRVVEVLKSDYITQGPVVSQFESAIAKQCHAKYAIACNSATSALHIACLALGVGQGDIVWTSPISFVASSNCALYCGASVDFIDIDINSGNISPEKLTEKLAQAQKNNTLPKAIILVHLAGQSCQMDKIKQLTKQYNIALIEDASHAIGARYQGYPVGSCQFSDITIFSFHPVKIITSAEGGMAVTNNQELARKMQRLRSHGITNQSDEMTEPSHGPWYYQQIELGFNYRMTELQAALGLSQSSKLAKFVEQRNNLASYYDKAFNHSAITPLTPQSDAYSAYHLYIVLLPELDKSKHKQVICALRDHNIFAHVHYIPIHTQPYYQNLGFNLGDFPVAEEYYNRAISLPLFPQLTVKEQDYIIETLLNVIK
ncbi:UDP-4-amino-4,6-dideoxy-N-acetyl-beta-L-altrosamine transaminase [Litorilituus sediminis]|uniref:UDP-4-amino-4, 6-dideoxy-N-acetyl-beta-L-altrosamine transaminase n=1 Tax=Litorilituus sediminis TaxID=718192 RepID=A0A4P6PBM3_9GAMM|nr:UDP-4-amino-4,6-dideoxy-N-acetyl-beta-L-altrosamine transaminase [Litorilituus sediminis]QBG37729.1 UDP-4-amino-4,6-dideoxy-N-acetyl-beta-L-altrosamine transaminase [Litorilituus sediminis]